MELPRWLLRRDQLPGWLGVAWAVAMTIREVVGIAGDVDFLKSQGWGWSTPTDILFHPGFLLLVLLAGVAWLVYVGPRLYLRGSYIRGERVHIADLVRNVGPNEQAVVRDKFFEDCEIVGPALLVLIGTGLKTFTESTFDAPMDAVFVPTKEGQAMAGVIGVDGVVIKGCQLRRISIAGTAKAIKQWKSENAES